MTVNPRQKYGRDAVTMEINGTEQAEKGRSLEHDLYEGHRGVDNPNMRDREGGGTKRRERGGAASRCNCKSSDYVCERVLLLAPWCLSPTHEARLC
jgi:hypothetical protein